MRVQRYTLAMGLMLALLVGCAAPAPAPTPTKAPTAVPVAPTAAATETPTIPPTSQPTPEPSPTAEPSLAEVKVYFLDTNRFNAGTLPFETPVVRQVRAGSNLPEAVLRAYFAGPTEEEKAQGLRALTSGFTGFSSLVVEGGYARVYLAGPCASNGATYTIAQQIIANLRQFDSIKYVKIYDSEGVTTDPGGETNSIPLCLEP